MMYIEQTSLEDNLNCILTNRVPTSSSPGASEAEAVAASALLARIRETQNGALSENAPLVSQAQKLQLSQAQKLQFYKERFRIPESKPIPSLQQLQEQLKGVNGLAQPDEYGGYENGLAEEPYEFVHVLGRDQQEEKETDIPKSFIEKERFAKNQINNSLSSPTHLLINVNDTEQHSKTEDEEEFEYIVTRVPKRKNNSYAPYSKVDIGGGDFTPLTSQRLLHSFKKQKRPVPAAIPIDCLHKKLHNGNFNSLNGNSGDHFSGRDHYLNGYPESYVGPENLNHFESFNKVRENICHNDASKQEEAQMGLISRLKELLNWKSSSPPSSGQNTPAQNDNKRKRRSGDLSDDSSNEHMIKYRKVENRFPKYVSRTEEDDDIKFISPLPPQSAQTSNQFQSNMSVRPSPSSIDKSTLRKSMFKAPNITKVFVKNTAYADIEFPDVDEPISLKPSTSAAAKNMRKLYNIPIAQNNERANCLRQRSPKPQLIEQDFGRKYAYLDSLRRDRVERNSHLLGTRNHSVSSMGETSTTDSSRLHNGFGNMRTNIWSNINCCSSILTKERESEQREKYRQLLGQAVPRLYGSLAENKIPTIPSTQHRRSALVMGAPSSSSRSSSANARRSVGLNQSILKRPPLSSTINLGDDDDDNDVQFTGIEHWKSSARKPKEQLTVPTIIIDDDDISDITDLGAGERHMLSQVGKIKQQEQNSILGKSGQKPKKPMNNALPYVEPVNSLKDRFSASVHIKEGWLENWQRKWSQRKRNKLVEVQETVQVAEKLSAERKAAEAEIQERLRSFQIVDPELLVVDDFEDLIAEPEFVELNEQQRETIDVAVFGGSPEEVLVSKFNLNITRRDIHTLCGQSWLNDEVINFYMNLLTERGDLKQSQGFPSVYAMNTFFVPRLLQSGHGGVKRWTRKVDIFAKDIIPLPVHVGGVHWCMAIIHMKNRSIKYYDSMGTPNPKVLQALEQYLKDESVDKRKQQFDTSGFQIESVPDVPRQMNGSDCGVFSCMFAEYITRNKEITFSQQNMEYFRRKMILEIVTGELLQ